MANTEVGQQLLAATKIIEDSVDAQIERLDNLDGDELENIRKQRMDALRKRALKKNEWIANVCKKYNNFFIVFLYLHLCHAFYISLQFSLVL